MPFVWNSIRCISIMFKQTECYIITTRRTHLYRGTWLLSCQHHSTYLLKHKKNIQNKELKLIRVIWKTCGTIIWITPTNCTAKLTKRFSSWIAGHVPAFCVGSAIGSGRKVTQKYVCVCARIHTHARTSTHTHTHKETVLNNVRGSSGAPTNMLHGIYPCKLRCIISCKSIVVLYVIYNWASRGLNWDQQIYNRYFIRR